MTASAESRYSASRVDVEGIPNIVLKDATSHMELKVAPSFGNNAWSMQVNGQEVFFSPETSLAQLIEKHPLMGNPLLAPWANRLDREGFFANGKYYRLNADLHNLRRDKTQQPIHGLLAFAKDWQVVDLRANDYEAAVVSRIEFWRHPDWMAQFPFAFNLEVTYRLTQGRLEVITRIENVSTETMPISLAFHPYFALSGVPRDEWSIDVPAASHVELNEKLTPTGELKPSSLQRPQPLAGVQLDDVYTGLKADADGYATIVVSGGSRRLTIRFSPEYPVAVIFAPPGRPFLCVEPMTGPTNVFNLAHEGKWPVQPSVAPDKAWTATYTIEPSGY